MRTIACDSCCLIDMETGGLLEAALNLPYRFEIPDVLFEDEILSLSNPEKKHLKNLGLKVIVLSETAVFKASEHYVSHSALSLNDCYVLALTEQKRNSILLTGDGYLRNVADKMGIEVHGALWIIDELHAHRTVETSVLLNSLNIFKKDETVFLPDDEIQKRVKRLSQFR